MIHRSRSLLLLDRHRLLSRRILDRFRRAGRRRFTRSIVAFDVNEPFYLQSCEMPSSERSGSTARQRARKRERERRSQRGEQSAIVISYPSRPRLVRPLDTGLENVNRSSTVCLDDDRYSGTRRFLFLPGELPRWLIHPFSRRRTSRSPD